MVQLLCCSCLILCAVQLALCASIVTQEPTITQTGVTQHNVGQGGHFYERNISDHGTGDHGNDSHSGSHVSIHVASWNFHHVQQPLIIAVFLLTAGIVKLGKYCITELTL